MKDGGILKRIIKIAVCLLLLVSVVGSAVLLYRGHQSYEDLINKQPLDP